MSVQDCIFCKIIDGQIPCTKIYENDHVLAFLDIGPVSEGHTLIVPKKHTCRVDQTDSETMSEIAAILPKLTASIQQAMESDGYNVLSNNGTAAGQLVDHLHFHIIPRNVNDGVFNRWPAFEYPQGKAQTIADQIKQKLAL